MKQAELDIIKARCEAATPGPWVWHIGGDHDWLGPEDGLAILDDGSAAGEYQQVIAGDSPDGEFIAHAREDVPVLVAEIERLWASLEAILEEAETDCDQDIIITECQSALARKAPRQ